MGNWRGRWSSCEQACVWHKTIIPTPRCWAEAGGSQIQDYFGLHIGTLSWQRRERSGGGEKQFFEDQETQETHCQSTPYLHFWISQPLKVVERYFFSHKWLNKYIYIYIIKPSWSSCVYPSVGWGVLKPNSDKLVLVTNTSYSEKLNLWLCFEATSHGSQRQSPLQHYFWTFHFLPRAVHIFSIHLIFPRQLTSVNWRNCIKNISLVRITHFGALWNFLGS